MADSALLTLDSVSKSFAAPLTGRPETVALETLSLLMKPGERTAFLGRSGCGKSTLLRVTAGLVRQDSGTVTFRGSEVTAPSLDRVLVFQEPRLLPWLSVAKNLQFGRQLSLAEVDELLEFVDLADIGRSSPLELSGGMAQRVALARALALRPALLLLDEPLGALDIHTRLSLQQRLCERWSHDGTAVMLVTHDLDEAIYVADRVLVLGTGGVLLGDIAIDLPRAPRRARDGEDFAHYRREARRLVSQ